MHTIGGPMSNTYLNLDREYLFGELKKIFDACIHINMTDEQLYFMADAHIKAMLEQGYLPE